MAIKVHGHPLSPASLRVLLCLTEKGLDYEFVLVDLTTDEHKKEPYISLLNPFSQVPAFEDGNLKLIESRAISQYIAHTHADKGTPLILKDPHKMAIIAMWQEIESQKFDAVASKLSYQILINPMIGLPVDEALVEKLQGQLATVLDVYESRLSESKYLGGDNFSLADLHHIPIIHNLMSTEVKGLFNKRPHVAAWCADILARPAWKKVLAELN